MTKRTLERVLVGLGVVLEDLGIVDGLGNIRDHEEWREAVMKLLHIEDEHMPQGKEPRNVRKWVEYFWDDQQIVLEKL